MLLHLTQLLSVITDITARPLHLPYVGTQGSPINSPRTSPQGRSLVGGCHHTTPWGRMVRPFGAVFWVALTGTWPWVWKRTIFTLTVVFVMLCGNKITFCCQVTRIRHHIHMGCLGFDPVVSSGLPEVHALYSIIIVSMYHRGAVYM